VTAVLGGHQRHDDEVSDAGVDGGVAARAQVGLQRLVGLDRLDLDGDAVELVGEGRGA
jgi:hypothetical protein